MKIETNLKRAAACFAGLALGASLWGQTPTLEEMWALIQKQQAEIQSLQARLNEAEGKVEVNEAKAEATASYVETLSAGSVQPSHHSHGSSGLGTRLGGYGEAHLNIGKNDQIDFHRWVLFLGHDFNESVRLFSEVEIEHSLSGDGAPGEVELEQAYVEFDLSSNSQAKAGLFLLPVGILNETHEPATFFGVERNGVESQIIPSTWWEAGAAYSAQSENGLSFDLALHSGLFTPTTGSNAFRIRSGRQKVAEAEASKFATTARLKYSGIPGATFATSLQYQQDLTQGMFSESIGATLFETHVDFQNGPWGLRALYARWDLSGNAPAAIGADEQFGYYLEPSYTFETERGEVGLFTRYSTYDLRAGGSGNTEDSFIDLGVNYWPIDNVVFKFDFQFTDFADSSKDEEIINLGIGYHF